jgi:hypothetical protein
MYSLPGSRPLIFADSAAKSDVVSTITVPDVLLPATGERLMVAAAVRDDGDGLGLLAGLGLADASSARIGGAGVALQPSTSPIAKIVRRIRPHGGLADLSFSICGHLGSDSLCGRSKGSIKLVLVAIRTCQAQVSLLMR